jgi:hypothetical protein
MLIKSLNIIMIRLICLLLIVCALNGCVGFAVGTIGEVEKKQIYTTNQGVLINTDYEGKERFKHSGGEIAYTKEQVISLLGEPDGRSVDGNCEVLSYNNGVNWGWGGAFIIFIPIGLVFPVGIDETKIYFRNGKNWAFISEEIGITSKFGPFCFLFTHGGNCDLHKNPEQVDVSAFCQYTFCKENDKSC